MSQKTISSQQYRATSVEISKLKVLDSVGVLCTWYRRSSQSPETFVLDDSTDQHSFIPLQMYMFTLTSECFKEFICNSDESSSVISLNLNKFKLATSNGFILTKECLKFLENRISFISKQSKSDIQEITDDISEPQVIEATRIWSFTLTRRLKQQICNGMQLNDLHIEAYQSLVRSKFPLLGGLQSTVCQNSHPLNLKAINYQIIHVRSNHWALLQIIKDEANQPNVSIIDSAYDDVDVKTNFVISQLIRFEGKSIPLRIMNVSKQVGITDCGLYAIANLTALVLGNVEPTNVVFDQRELRSHYLECLENQKVMDFPVLKHRRIQTKFKTLESILIYCFCHCGDDGLKMVVCEQCEEWYHYRCINKETIEENALWYYTECHP